MATCGCARYTYFCVLTAAARTSALISAYGPVLDYHEDVEAAQEVGVDVGEVDREDRVSLRGEELPPGRPGPSRSGIEASVLEDRPDS